MFANVYMKARYVYAIGPEIGKIKRSQIGVNVCERYLNIAVRCNVRLKSNKILFIFSIVFFFTFFIQILNYTKYLFLHLILMFLLVLFKPYIIYRCLDLQICSKKIRSCYHLELHTYMHKYFSRTFM